MVTSGYSSLTVTAKSRGTTTITATADDVNMEVEATQDVSLSTVFRNADADALTNTAETSDFEIAEALEFQGTLTVIAIADGSTTITVTAKDSDGKQVSDAFDVSVSQPEVDHSEPTPVANLRCIAKTDQVAFLWDEPEWSGGELYACDYDLTLPTGKREQVRFRGFSVVNEPGDYQVGKETSISVKVVYELPDGSEVYSAAATLSCTVAE